jgi:hypothetical protein
VRGAILDLSISFADGSRRLGDRVEGNSRRYLKIYLGILFVSAPMVAIKLVLFR